MQQLLFVSTFNKYKIFHKQQSNTYLLLFQILIYNIYLFLLFNPFTFHFLLRKKFYILSVYTTIFDTSRTESFNIYLLTPFIAKQSSHRFCALQNRVNIV